MICCAVLSGCATSAYYTKPSSKGYNVAHFNATCSGCNRVFSFSQAMFDSGRACCPYCGKEQNLAQANKRYTYDTQARQRTGLINALSNLQNSDVRGQNNSIQKPSMLPQPKRYDVYNNTGQQIGTARESTGGVIAGPGIQVVH